MSDLKTKPSQASVEAFLRTIEDEQKQADSRVLIDLMARVSGAPATIWGDSMVGFGSYHYRYASGREGDWFLTGFSPRKRAFSLYIMAGFGAYQALLNRLGRHKHGKSCLYVNKLADIDLSVLEQLVKQSVAYMRETYNEVSPP